MRCTHFFSVSWLRGRHPCSFWLGTCGIRRSIQRTIQPLLNEALPARPSEDEGRNGEAWWRLAARLASDSPIDFRSALGSHLKWAGGRIVLRFIRFAKITVLASAVWTIFCATFIFSWQLISWFRSGSWDFFPISWAVLPIKYTTASAGQNSPQPTVLQYVVDQLLEIPAIVPLAIASALLFGFYIRLSIMERQLQ
jgi:hypothetical protein